MTSYIALLRAVNVGGTGKLPMADLKDLCADLGFSRIETLIASGNVVFDCPLAAVTVRSKLEEGLHAYAGKAVSAFVRTAAQMRAVLEGNPFSDQEPRHTHAFFLHHKPPPGTLSEVRGRTVEELHLGQREIYVYYPMGMGQSRLQIPAATTATSRNLNTVARLVQMSARS